MKKIDYDPRDVLRSQLPTLLIARRVAAEFRIHRTRHDVTDLDVVVTHFLHQRLAETVEAELRSIVGGHSRMRIRAGERRDVDDIATTALLQLRDSRVTTVIDAEEICFQHRPKIFR